MNKKSPLGIMPSSLYWEDRDFCNKSDRRYRAKQICLAIYRYKCSRKRIPNEWLAEFKNIVNLEFNILKDFRGFWLGQDFDKYGYDPFCQGFATIFPPLSVASLLTGIVLLIF